MAKRKNDFNDDFEFINQSDAEKHEEQTAENLASPKENLASVKENLASAKESSEQETAKAKKEQANENKQKQAKSFEENLAQVNEYKTLLQLTKAEFDNYRKRSFTLLQNAKTDGEINIISKFLPSLDSFKKAKEMIFDEKVLKGVEMIEKDIIDALKRIGVEEINPIGKQFDANFHNAISVINNPSSQEGVVEQVYQNGYCYNGKVIRYAQVIINKHNTET